MKKNTNVGNDIEQTEAGWEFDDGVVDTFDTHIARSIPNYTKIQDQVVKFVDWYTVNGGSETVYDLGCATGTTLKTLIEDGTRNPTRTYIGIDESKPMLEKAREKLAHHKNVRLVEDDLTERRRYPNANVVISLFTLSFIPEADRERVLRRVYRDLAPGGVLIFVEKTYPEFARNQAIFREHYWDYKAQSFDADEIVGKASTLRGQLRPLSKAEYRDMLTDAGFEEVEPWYQYYMWWGVVARKRPGSANHRE